MSLSLRRSLLLTASALVLSACCTTSAKHSVATAAGGTFVAAEVLASAKGEIEAANAAWLPGLRNRDAASIAAGYADDGIFVAPDGSVTRGREAITAMYAGRFPKLREILGGEVVQDGVVAINPTLIYEWGHAWLEMAPARAGDAPVRSGGAYLTVWQRGSDGHWRITRNVAL